MLRLHSALVKYTIFTTRSSRTELASFPQRHCLLEQVHSRVAIPKSYICMITCFLEHTRVLRGRECFVRLRESHSCRSISLRRPHACSPSTAGGARVFQHHPHHQRAHVRGRAVIWARLPQAHSRVDRIGGTPQDCTGHACHAPGTRGRKGDMFLCLFHAVRVFLPRGGGREVGKGRYKRGRKSETVVGKAYRLRRSQAISGVFLTCGSVALRDNVPFPLVFRATLHTCVECKTRQYFLQLVPTVYRRANGATVHSNQYSATEHLKHVHAGELLWWRWWSLWRCCCSCWCCCRLLSPLPSSVLLLWPSFSCCS